MKDIMYCCIIISIIFFILVSAENVSPDCEIAVKELFVEGSLPNGNQMRREWLHIAPFVIDQMEEILKKNALSTWSFWDMFQRKDKYSLEVKYEHNHERFNLLGPVLPACKHELEKYGDEDEEKRVCGLKRLEKLIPHCVIYSIGSNNQWGFERDIYKHTNCSIETFDCTPPNYTTTS